MRESWIPTVMHRHLDPGESLAEILFGLIMTLTFTLGAGLLVQAGPGAVRELLIATIGCNIAWGVIDGALYITGQVFERARLTKVGDEVRAARDESAAATVVDTELDPLFGLEIEPQQRHAICRQLAAHIRANPARAVGLRATDFKGAAASFLLVFCASFPAALPFMFIADATLALRVSNGILIALLFLTGFRWARYTALKPWLTGLTLMCGGIAMVGLAIALGG